MRKDVRLRARPAGRVNPTWLGYSFGFLEITRNKRFQGQKAFSNIKRQSRIFLRQLQNKICCVMLLLRCLYNKNKHLPVLEAGAAGGGVQGGVGPLEAPLSSQPRFGDGMTFHLLLHLLPLLAGQQEVHVLGGDVVTVGVLEDAEVYRNLVESREEVEDTHIREER